MMNYRVSIFMKRFLISRAIKIMHESLCMTFMMTLQCVNACTLIKVVLIYFTYDLDAHDLDCAKSYFFVVE